MSTATLSAWGAACLPAYLGISLLIGWCSRPRRNTSANSFLNASRALPLPLVVAAFLAANCGALEVVGLSAMAAQYGALAFHFYWIGAIPAMIFLGLYLLPVYRASKVRSVPEFLGLRFGAPLQVLNACTVALTMLLLSGISLYAIAQVGQVMVHLNFLTGVSVAAGVVLVYVLLGGVRATIYTEVFQLGVMLCGLTPLAWRSGVLLHRAKALPPRLGHAWAGMHAVNLGAPMDGLGIIFGLGFVLSCGYWCTDFVLMQRALTARTELQARSVPLWAGFGKLFFGLLVVLPGLAIARLGPAIQPSRYDQSLPVMMRALYGPTLLGLGFTALAASLMSGVAANITAFSAVWTQDLYRPHLRPGLTEAHYLRVGRLATIAAALAGVCCSAASFRFNNIMEHVQLLFALFNAPFWAIFLLGILSKRVTTKAAIFSFVAGFGAGLANLGAVSLGLVHYGSRMSSDFYSAIFAFSAAMLTGWGLTCLLSANAPRTTARDSLRWVNADRRMSGYLVSLALLLLFCCCVLNWLWW